MNRIVLALFVSSIMLFSAEASNVLWGRFVGETVDFGIGQPTFNVYYYGYVDGTIQSNPEIAFLTGGSESSITLTPTASTVNASVTELWLAMNLGEEISYNSVRNAGRYLFDTVTSPYGDSDYGLSIEAGDQIYLVFESIESQDKSIYGWVSLSYQNGALLVQDSAFDADGGPMIVGGGSALTPEPSAALLLLVGGALLALKRRQKMI